MDKSLPILVNRTTLFRSSYIVELRMNYVSQLFILLGRVCFVNAKHVSSKILGFNACFGKKDRNKMLM